MKNPAVAVLVVALTPIVLLILAFAGTEANKAYWDWQVREMCEKDGGVAVYKNVFLPNNSKLISSSGNIIIPSERGFTKKDKYYVSFLSSPIKSGKLSVRRTETKIIRVSDSKTISLRVSYSRSGGDFPTIIGAPSSFSCRDMGGMNTDLISTTFQIGGI